MNEHILDIAHAALASVDAQTIVKRCLKLNADTLTISSDTETYSIPMEWYDRVFVFGLGKAAARMAGAAETVLGDRLRGGCVAVKRGYADTLVKLPLIEAGHPVPDEDSLRAARTFLDFLKTLAHPLSKRDLVLVLVSGGGSAVCAAPVEGLTLADIAELTEALLRSGAAIDEINIVRKHISRFKGGQFAAALYPARIITLAISDVVGDSLESIASGPTVPDTSTKEAAEKIIRAYGLADGLCEKLLRHCIETPKAGDIFFDDNLALTIATNRTALRAAQKKAEALGYRSLVLSSRVQGEAREVARLYEALGMDIALNGMPLAAPACVIAGGETTVTLRGSGRGGRNQEMTLAFLAALGRHRGTGSHTAAASVRFASFGTDGSDGPTDAAGASCDAAMYERAIQAGIKPEDFLRNNDSYGFFKRLGGHIHTGPTNTNVCDIQILTVGEP